MMKMIKESSPFTRVNYNAFAGTTHFKDGTAPLSFVVEDGDTTIYVLAGGNGVEVVIQDDNESDSVSLFNNDFDEEKFRLYIPDYNRKNAIISTFNRVVSVIKESMDTNIYKVLLFNLDGFSIAIG